MHIQVSLWHGLSQWKATLHRNGVSHWLSSYPEWLLIFVHQWIGSDPLIISSGPVFCLLLGVSSGYAQPITGQVTEVTCPVIGWAQPELTLSKRQKTDPDDGLVPDYGWIQGVITPGVSRVCSVTPTVLDGFFPYQAQIIIIMGVWHMTLTYIFKVIQPWLCSKTAKICHILYSPLYSMYSFGWILSIFGTNNH